MKDKLNQFISNTNGQFIEVSDRTNIYQCLDLVYLWVFCLNIPKATIQHLYAYEVYTKASDFTRQYFDVIKNEKDTIPQDGDIAVFKGGTAGHIAIALGGGNTNKFMRFEQNKPLGTHAHVQEGNYYNILGFLRPKNVIIGNVPQWLSTLLQERNLTIEKESEIRVIFDKAKRYDDEIKVLQEQVKLANESLADKALEVSSLTGKVESLTSKKDEYEKLYNDAKSERDTFLSEKEVLAIQNEKLISKVQSLEKENETFQKGIETLELHNKDLKTQLAESQALSLREIDTSNIIKELFRRLFRKGGE